MFTVAGVLENVIWQFLAVGAHARRRSVGELTEDIGLSQANASKHLQVLLAHQLVARRKEGLYAYYRIADESVFQLCELGCSRLEASTRERQRRLARG